MGPGKYISRYFFKKEEILKMFSKDCTNLKKKYKSFQSVEANCLSCLSTLFALEEFKIYEDFLQLSDLVEAEKIFVNRTELSTNGKVKLFSDLLKILKRTRVGSKKFLMVLFRSETISNRITKLNFFGFEREIHII